MWFSKTQKKSDPRAGSAAVARPMPVVGRVSEPVRAAASPEPALSLVVPATPAPAPVASVRTEVLGEFKSVPDGALVTHLFDLSSEVEQEFVIIEEAPGAACIVCSDAIFGKPMMYNVQRKADKLDYKRVRVARASSEVLKTVRDARTAEREREISMHGEDATAAERTAAEIFAAAVKAGGSDIHMETRREEICDISFRIDGARKTHKQIGYKTAKQVCVSIYSVHADSASKDRNWDARQPRQGMIEHTLEDGRKVNLRFFSGPIYPGENFQAVMRLSGGSTTKAYELGELGLTDAQVAMIKSLLLGSKGLILLVGPTNGGKSTLMKAMLRFIFDTRGKLTKVITVEDPVEDELPYANQVSVARKTSGEVDGASMADHLRGILRQDPDVVGVGEMRLPEVAEEVMGAALAGRKTLATLHAFSALGGFERLRELGVPARLLTMPGFIAGLIYVRLVPLLCECSIPVRQAAGDGRIELDLMNRIRQVADLDKHDVRVRGGCIKCDGTGVKGRTACAEFVVPGRDHKLLKLISKERMIEADEHWRNTKTLRIDEDLGPTALAHAISKMRVGRLDPRDVEEQIESLDADLFANEAVNGGEEA